MSFLRKKVVELDGATVTVSGLTGEQVDRFLSRQAEIKQMGEGDERTRFEKAKAFTEFSEQFVADCINNATGETNGNKMTSERVHKEFDRGFVTHLVSVCLDMSKLGGGEGNATSA